MKDLLRNMTVSGMTAIGDRQPAAFVFWGGYILDNQIYTNFIQAIGEGAENGISSIAFFVSAISCTPLRARFLSLLHPFAMGNHSDWLVDC